MFFEFDRLNKEQKAAVLDTNNPCRIIAGPGSGKSRIIISKFLHLIHNNNLNPEKILVITFTNKAADNIKKKILLSLDEKEIDYDINNMSISTIHSLCKSIIDNNKKLIIGELNATNILDTVAQGAFILSFIENYGFYSKASSCRKVYEIIIPFFNKIADENLKIDQVINFLHDNLREIFNHQKINKPKKKEIKKIKKLILYSFLYLEYSNRLKEKKLIDFSHLQKFVYYELMGNKKLLTKIRNSYDYILVDEFQDTSFLQTELILMISEPEYKFTVCGDDDQSLYRFRGATVENFLGLHNRINKEIHDYYIKKNYRSTKLIVDNSNKLIQNNKGFRFNKEFEVVKEENGLCCKLISETPEDEAKNILSSINKLYDKKIINSLSEIAILFRSVAFHSKELMREINNADLPYIIYGTEKLSTSRLSVSFLNVLEFVSKKSKVLETKNNILFKQENNELVEINYKDNISELEENTSEENFKYIKKLLEIRKNKNQYKSNISIFYSIITNSPILKELIEKEKHEDLLELAFISQIIIEVDTAYQRTDPYLIHSIFQELSIKGDIEKEKENIEGRLNIMTIHQSKGLEFPIVILPSLYKRRKKPKLFNYLSDLFHYETSDEEKIKEIDQRKLIYVGLTRAQEAAVLSLPKKRIWGSGYCKARPIKPVNEMDVPEVYKEKIENLNRINININNHSPDKKKLILSFSKIRTYIECPRKYYLMYNLGFATVLESQMLFGLSIHNALEEIHNNYIEKSKDHYTMKEMENLLDINWVSITYKKRQQKKYKETATKYLLEYVLKEKHNFKYITKAEEPFQLNKKAKGYVINGVIDLISQNNGNVILTDFKVGNIKNPLYKFQMQLYSLCFEKIYNKKPERLVIYNLKQSDKIELNYREKLKNFSNFLDNIVDNMREKNFTPKIGNNCRYCPYKKFCRQ